MFIIFIQCPSFTACNLIVTIVVFLRHSWSIQIVCTIPSFEIIYALTCFFLFKARRDAEAVHFHDTSASTSIMKFKWSQLSRPQIWMRSTASTSLLLHARFCRLYRMISNSPKPNAIYLIFERVLQARDQQSWPSFLFRWHEKQVIQGSHMVSSTRCPALSDSWRSGVIVGQRP